MWPRATCLDLSVPQLPHLRHGGSDGLPHRAAVRTKEERHMKNPVLCLEHRPQRVSVDEEERSKHRTGQDL